MAYFAPYIDESGLHIPTYQDIVDALVSDAKEIFGQDIYLEIDSQDYQWISAVADKIHDSMLTNQLVYNSRGPGTAIGSGLDIIVKLNGIKRDPATYSTCLVVISGIAGTVITNGIVADINNNNWNLPSTVTIGGGGIVTVLATCSIPGPVSVSVGDIKKVVTPTYGWNGVTNTVTATVGSNVEPDSKLRSRQVSSTSLPSRTVLEGTKGAIAAVSGVTRLIVYENDTNAADANGLPAHSITSVVESGLDADVGQAIFSKKGPGCYTNGTTLVNVPDAYGNTTPIRFYRPAYVDVDVVINVKALAGYTSQITADIKANVAAFLSGLNIGDDVSISSLWGISLTAMPNLKTPIFSITSLTAAKHSQVQGTADIPIAFNEVSRGNVLYITVNVT